ncbi:putative ribonuclease H-like domain-containing protein [Tanacetum coccineum]
MTRSSTKELLTPYKEPKGEFPSSRKHFKTLSLDELRSSDFDLFSNQEEYSEEEVTETMVETMEKYMSKTRADYGSGIARPKIEDKDSFELKGQFLKELRVVLGVLTASFGVTGYSLPRDQTGYWAVKIVTGVPDAIPVIGAPLVELVRDNPL